MHELQEQLIRASTLARLQSIITIVQEYGTDISALDKEDRKWFAELLHPFTSQEAGDWCLLPSPHVSSIEGSAILDVLIATHAPSQDLAVLQADLIALGDLRGKLLGDAQSLSQGESRRLLETARSLRQKFIEDDSMPEPPSLDGDSILRLHF